MALDLTDKTANGNDLVNGNSVSDVTTGLPTNSNHAAGFLRASSKYLQVINASASLSPAAAITIMARLRIDTLLANNTSGVILANWYDGENHYLFRFDNESNVQKLNLFISNGTTSEKFSYSHSLTADSLFHTFGAGWQGSDKAWELIIDDVSVASGNGSTVAAMDTTARHPVIGGNNVYPTPSDDFGNITIDYVRAYNTKRSLVSQQGDSANKFISGSSANLIADWPFEPLTSVKTVNGLARASVKTMNGLAIASVKTINGLA